jgi:hypothetical protein
MTIALHPTPHSTLRTPHFLAVAWQGVRFGVPDDWSPVKIEGDFDKGFISLADLERTRLGVRWQRPRKPPASPVEMKKVVAEAIKREVGQLAFGESIESSSDAWPAARLFVEPDPPGRDVWIGYSPRTNRVVEFAYQATRREPTLRDALVPTIRDEGEDDGKVVDWSVFWHNVSLPRAMKLTGQRLNVGDLSLSFETGSGPLVVRQVAAAGMALSRRPIESWLTTLGEPKRYRPVGKPDPVAVDGREGVRQRHVRRRRLFYMRWIPACFEAHAVRDAGHDRLILVRAPDGATAEGTIRGVGGVEILCGRSDER